MNTNPNEGCIGCKHDLLPSGEGPCGGCYVRSSDTFQNWEAKTADDLTQEQRDVLSSGGTVLGRDAKSWGVGMRFVAGKSPVWQGFINYFPDAMREVAKVSEFGAKKYDWNNWQQLDNGYTNCTNSLARHLCNEAEKGMFGLDDESELLEAAHSAWNAMARLQFVCKELAKRDQGN